MNILIIQIPVTMGFTVTVMTPAAKAVVMNTRGPCSTGETCSESQDTCFTTSSTTTTIPNTTTTTIPNTTTTTPPTICDVVISPSSLTVDSEESVEFTAVTSCDGEEIEGTYVWELNTSIGSGITPDGSTCSYQAGSNTTAILQTDTITVFDSTNETTEDVTVTVSYGRIAGVFPRAIFSSRWLPLPRLMFIIGSNTDI